MAAFYYYDMHGDFIARKVLQPPKARGKGWGRGARRSQTERDGESVTATSGLEWGAMIYRFIMTAVRSHWSIFK